jgi:hypothetical protein
MLGVKIDDSKLKRRTTEMSRLLPKVTADALNWTIFNVRDAHRGAMASVFDRPTPFTLNNSNLVIRATPATQKAKTKLRDDQSTGIAPIKYLRPQIFGGDRGIKRFEKALQARGLMPNGWYAMPGNGAKLNAYGNMNGGLFVQILSVLGAAEQTSGYSANQTYRSSKRNKKPRDYFVSRPGATNNLRGAAGRLPYGVYQRLPGGRIVTILRFRPRVKYQPRFDYHGIAKKVAATDFPRLMRKAWQRVTAIK